MHKLKKKDYNGIKAGIWYTIGNIIIKGIPFFTIPIFTRLLTTNDFGIYSIYLSYEEILSVVIGLGISGTVKIAKFEFKNEFEKYISSVINLIAIVGIIFLVISNFLYPFLIFQEWLSRFVVNLIIVQSISVAIYFVVSSKYIIDGDYIKNLLVVFFMTILNIAISLILCLYFFKDNSYLGRIIGTALGAIFIAIFIIFNQNKISTIISKKKYNRFALVLGLPLIFHQLSISLLAQSDKIMIQALVGNKEAGVYSIGVIITSVLAVIISSIDSAWTPWFYSKLSEKKYDILIKN
ncbi:polysaccharide biosynthesis protein, partial [Fusobacterium nucleatum CC53]